MVERNTRRIRTKALPGCWQDVDEDVRELAALTLLATGEVPTPPMPSHAFWCEGEPALPAPSHAHGAERQRPLLGKALSHNMPQVWTLGSSLNSKASHVQAAAICVLELLSGQLASASGERPCFPPVAPLEIAQRISMS